MIGGDKTEISVADLTHVTFVELRVGGPPRPDERAGRLEGSLRRRLAFPKRISG
jgi:hypothetical protein